mmetsp:Transcript_149610/g.480203  ORF Transcript_149610/g.480203 Transcript_149610/m.480203 type:complete len:473 (-) Transcript_149610:2472-3890(-)
MPAPKASDHRATSGHVLRLHLLATHAEHGLQLRLPHAQPVRQQRRGRPLQHADTQLGHVGELAVAAPALLLPRLRRCLLLCGRLQIHVFRRRLRHALQRIPSAAERGRVFESRALRGQMARQRQGLDGELCAPTGLCCLLVCAHRCGLARAPRRRIAHAPRRRLAPQRSSAHAARSRLARLLASAPRCCLAGMTPRRSWRARRRGQRRWWLPSGWPARGRRRMCGERSVLRRAGVVAAKSVRGLSGAQRGEHALKIGIGRTAFIVICILSSGQRCRTFQGTHSVFGHNHFDRLLAVQHGRPQKPQRGRHRRRRQRPRGDQLSQLPEPRIQPCRRPRGPQAASKWDPCKLGAVGPAQLPLDQVVQAHTDVPQPPATLPTSVPLQEGRGGAAQVRCEGAIQVVVGVPANDRVAVHANGEGGGLALPLLCAAGPEAIWLQERRHRGIFQRLRHTRAGLRRTAARTAASRTTVVGG